MVKRLTTLIQLITYIVFLSGLQAYPQEVVADFNASVYEGCSPLNVIFNNTSKGPDLTYKWTFDTIGSSSAKDTIFNFYNPKGEQIYRVRLVVTSSSTMNSDTIIKNITVKQTPSAYLTIDSTNACVNGDVGFFTSKDSKDYVIWDFGDGNILYDNILLDDSIAHAYSHTGTYKLQFTTSWKGCSQTFNRNIKVDGPVAGINMSDNEACIGSPILFSLIHDTSGISKYYWDFGDGNSTTGDSVYHAYDYNTNYLVKLHVYSPTDSCIINKTATILKVKADFSLTAINGYCDQQFIKIGDKSIGADSA
jgi:PKD repeat protein